MEFNLYHAIVACVASGTGVAMVPGIGHTCGPDGQRGQRQCAASLYRAQGHRSCGARAIVPSRSRPCEKNWDTENGSGLYVVGSTRTLTRLVHPNCCRLRPRRTVGLHGRYREAIRTIGSPLADAWLGEPCAIMASEVLDIAIGGSHGEATVYEFSARVPSRARINPSRTTKGRPAGG
jgi:hypothetical protein